MALIIAIIALVLLALPLFAQESTPEPDPEPTLVTVTVGAERVPIQLPADEAMVAYVWADADNPHGQFTTMVAFANIADVGMTQLTPCDNIVVECRSFTVRAEGVNQGDVFGLGFIEGGS